MPVSEDSSLVKSPFFEPFKLSEQADNKHIKHKTAEKR